ncbi:cupin domain-containing protein [Kitasatospora sp. NPDC056651]|uniref:cupin domain-containing protein n=1 Tax=Kitasatospora sp. NPDC056651 TaxID=3345892 RepID=UPI0036A2A618
MTSTVPFAVPFAVPVEDVELTRDPGFPGEVLAGSPRMSSAVLWQSGDREVVRGVWQVEPSTFTWAFSRNEVLVVLRGSARVRVEGGPELELRPGVVAGFRPGDRTTWTVTETLRKFFTVDSVA